MVHFGIIFGAFLGGFEAFTVKAKLKHLPYEMLVFGTLPRLWNKVFVNFLLKVLMIGQVGFLWTSHAKSPGALPGALRLVRSFADDALHSDA